MNRIEKPRSVLTSPRVVWPLALVILFSAGLQAQSLESVQQAAPAESTASTEAATQARIQRARVLIAAHRLETAASELETVRAATQDFAIRSITSVMLMNIYLEAGNYGRAEALLEECFRSRSVRNGDSVRTYFALAGQAVNGARTHLSRYRTFGINTSDSNLPAEAVTDLDRLRSFLERMIAQAKEISNERKAYDSLSLLEDVLGIRLSLARDGEDQAKWSADYVTARELLASSPIQIAALGGSAALPPGKVKSNKSPSPSPYSVRRGPEDAEKKAPAKTEDGANPRSADDSEISRSATPSPAQSSLEPKTDAGAATTPSTPTGQPLSDFGLLNAKASRRVLPRYPPLAKKAGAMGLVRVHVVVDENGRVIEVSKSEGPALLRQVAEDAARQWYFEGIAGPGQQVKFTGYIDFNFTL